jgi:hypothetical protein
MLSINCKHVHHVKIYLPCNFEVKQYLTWLFGSGELKNDEKRGITPRRVIKIAHLEVIALFQSNFKNVNTFHPLFQKL